MFKVIMDLNFTLCTLGMQTGYRHASHNPYYVWKVCSRLGKITIAHIQYWPTYPPTNRPHAMPTHDDKLAPEPWRTLHTHDTCVGLGWAALGWRQTIPPPALACLARLGNFSAACPKKKMGGWMEAPGTVQADC